jgi:hypothetical protein
MALPDSDHCHVDTFNLPGKERYKKKACQTGRHAITIAFTFPFPERSNVSSCLDPDGALQASVSGLHFSYWVWLFERIAGNKVAKYLLVFHD